MEYPFIIPGERSVDGHELMLLAPPNVVVRAEPLLPRESSVLDVGAYNGRTGFYLATKGHNVQSVEIEKDYILEGRRIGRELGSIALKNTFIQTDIADMDYDGCYDAVVATCSLQMVARAALHRTLSNVQNAAKPRGLNAIKAYVATPRQQALVPNRSFFEPNELFRIYKESGWNVINQEQKLQPLRRQENGNIFYTSYSELIARKPEPRRTRTYMNANREIIYTDD